jgi:hypothetical protein
MPFDEGRRYRVLRSGGVEALTGAEDQVVPGLVGGHREGPRDLRAVASDEEEQILFELLDDALGPLPGQLESVRDIGQSDGAAQTRKLSNNMVSDPVVVRRHETQTSADGLWSAAKLVLPIALRDFMDRVASANQ